MNLTKRNRGLFALALLISLLIVSCDSDANLVGSNESEGSGDPSGDVDDPSTPIEADKLADFLNLTGSQTITGRVAAGFDGGIKINSEDTIFVMKGFRYGARVVLKHDGAYDLTGVYIHVAGSSFHYDVPVVDAEAQDSTDVIYIGVDPPDELDVDYPLTIPITIYPHGPDFVPLDSLEREVTVEDPEVDMQNPRCAITRPRTSAPSFVWDWKYTAGIGYYGDLLPIESPDIHQDNFYTTGGCCNTDGTSSTVGNDATCTQNSDRFRSIEVSHYFRWLSDMLWLYDDGTFRQVNQSEQTNYRPSLSNFCTGRAAYDYDRQKFVKDGTHDFTQGADYVKISYNPTDPPVFGKIIGSGEVQHTCHMLVFRVGLEEQWDLVFEKLKDRLTDDVGESPLPEYYD